MVVLVAGVEKVIALQVEVIVAVVIVVVI